MVERGEGMKESPNYFCYFYPHPRDYLDNYIRVLFVLGMQCLLPLWKQRKAIYMFPLWYLISTNCCLSVCLPVEFLKVYIYTFTFKYCVLILLFCHMEFQIVYFFFEIRFLLSVVVISYRSSKEVWAYLDLFWNWGQ